MMSRFVGRVGIATLLVILGMAGLIWQVNGRPGHTGENVFALAAPDFVGAAHAQVPDGVHADIADEAGIAAYWKAPVSIDLSAVRPQFRTIERETADYIVGSAPVDGYTASEDVHVYVHKDGWVLGYYLAADPAGKIFDWRKYEENGRTTIVTKLESAMAGVVAGAGISLGQVTFYDFRFPNANRLMILVKTGLRDSSFDIKIPSSFQVAQRSWFLNGSGVGDLYLNGTKIANSYIDIEGVGIFSVIDMLPDEFQTIRVVHPAIYGGQKHGGLVLVYGE